MQCKAAISFPMTLDLTKLVHPVQGDVQQPANGETSAVAATPAEGSSAAADPTERSAAEPQQLDYELTAILLHRGSSASSGHYVSIVKDEQTGRWWKYDDDFVSDMGVHPFKGASWDAGSGEEPASTAAASVKGKAAAKKAAGKGKGGGGAKGKNAVKAGAKVQAAANDKAAPAAPDDADCMLVDDVRPEANDAAGDNDCEMVQADETGGRKAAKAAARTAPARSRGKRGSGETSAPTEPAPKKSRGRAGAGTGAARSAAHDANGVASGVATRGTQRGGGVRGARGTRGRPNSAQGAELQQLEEALQLSALEAGADVTEMDFADCAAVPAGIAPDGAADAAHGDADAGIAAATAEGGASAFLRYVTGFCTIANAATGARVSWSPLLC